ncbi:hypothetical protein GGR26_001692 [Lewinella marina]|uniref:Outer membrane protein beta-barrel domain-containing protein n=1 Tax=Neolewinella marina TaxID=438751 RepID=A0A2G0CDV1_9BACT|nr:outer membrane beta-barrel protein [Neolewinella marina]NJB85924.1 hypothetical protein [Neolewinella marina]PHK98100.1 hypothetical protein CGL56_12995 [Neolewinella marina]
MRYLILLLVLSLSATANGQLKKKTQILTSVITASDTERLPGRVQPITGLLLQEIPDINTTVASIGGSYGIAVRDQVAVGGSYRADFSFGENGNGVDHLMLCPWARGYLYNEPNLQVYGQLQTGIVYDSDEFDAFSTVIASAGVHVPIGPTIRFTPNISYAIQDGNNRVGIGANVEYHFTDFATEDREIDHSEKYTEGGLIVGAQAVNFGFADNSFISTIRIGGHYFPSDRWSVGGDLGLSYDRTTFDSGGSSGSKSSFSTTDINLGVNTRYYVAPERRFSGYGEAGAGYYSRGFNTSYSNGGESDGHPYLRLGAGAQTLLCRNLLLEAGPEFRLDLQQESNLVCGFMVGLLLLFGGMEAE